MITCARCGTEKKPHQRWMAVTAPDSSTAWYCDRYCLIADQQAISRAAGYIGRGTTVRVGR